MSKPLLPKTLVKRNEAELVNKEEENNNTKIFNTASCSLPPINKEKNLQTIVDCILPAKKIEYNEQIWLERASTNPSTRHDLVTLEERFENELKIRNAKLFGIDPVRRQIYDELFDELIRQVTVNCAERGLLLSRVRNEIRLTILSYQSLLESSIAYGLRKAIMVEKQQSEAITERDQERNRNKELEKKIEDLEEELSQEREIKEEEVRLMEETMKDENKRLVDANKTLRNVLQKIIQMDQEMKQEQHALSENFNFFEEYSSVISEKNKKNSENNFNLDNIDFDKLEIVEDEENSEKIEIDSDVEINFSDSDEIKSDNDEIKSNNDEVKSDNDEVKSNKDEIKSDNDEVKINNEIDFIKKE